MTFKTHSSVYVQCLPYMYAKKSMDLMDDKSQKIVISIFNQIHSNLFSSVSGIML